MAASGRGDYGRARVKTTRPATSEAHDYNVRGQKQSQSPLDHGAAMRSGYQLKNANEPRNDASMPMPKHANANE
eukprot:6179876-Pleurochrysis_carterae.AAC.2